MTWHWLDIDGPPKEDGEYLVFLEGGWTLLADFDGAKWLGADLDYTSCVVAWAALPNPPVRDSQHAERVLIAQAFPRLLAEHRGKWALAYRGDLTVWPTMDAALEAGYRLHGLGAFFMREITDNPLVRRV